MDDAALTQPAPTTQPVDHAQPISSLPNVEYGAEEITPAEESATQLPREARGLRWAAWQLAVVGVVVGIVAGAAVTFVVTRNSRTEHMTPPSATSAQSNASPPTAAVPTPEAAPAPSGAGCGVDLAAPRVVAAVQQLPPYPDTGWTWNADPATFQGNYNPCATLSTVLATVEMATGSSPVTALMFHNGDYLGTATLKAYPFTTLNTPQTTADTVVLDYKQPGACTACPPAGITTVHYQWQNDHVEMLDPAPPDPSAPTSSTESSPYSHVRTESGKTRCVVSSAASPTEGAAVACEYGPGFLQAPVSQYGNRLDIARVDAAGSFKWMDGNIGGGGTPQNDLVLNYGQTYHAQGWTIQPSFEGTRFTNDATGHGMFVAVQEVAPF